MITLFHGDDTASSRNAFIQAKQMTKNAVTFSADQINLTDLAQSLQGDLLFAEIKGVFLEDLFTKKKGDELTAITAYLTEQGKSHDIYLWEKKLLAPSVLKQLKNATIQAHKLPQELFRFLDAIRPDNAYITINLFHRALKTTEAEMLFFMLIRQFRLLLALREANAPIEEVQKLAPWQIIKLRQQAKLFSDDRLFSIYISLSEIDKEAKTGASTTPLTTTIDFLLLAL